MAARRDLFDPTDPSQFLPEQRLSEVAVIFAAGVIRMRERRAVSMPEVRPCRNSTRNAELRGHSSAAGTSRIPPDSGENRLELSEGTRPYGQRG